MQPIDPSILNHFMESIKENRYDFVKLAHIIFPFGEEGHPLEKIVLYPWQIEFLEMASDHFGNPETRDLVFRYLCSSGNGAAKTAIGAIFNFIMLYSFPLKAKITANTKDQLQNQIWAEYSKWFKFARFNENLFEKFGSGVVNRDKKLKDEWFLVQAIWDIKNPHSLSGLHNQGGAVGYTFEEGPGIPAKVWKFCEGAFTEINTMKYMLAFGNSEDPESYFESLFGNPYWKHKRIDIRTLPYSNKSEIQKWLYDAGGDEEDDDFRRKVRGLPSKSSSDSIIKFENVHSGLERRHDFDTSKVKNFPCILSCDPAWTGGDETTIWMRKGYYARLLCRFRLVKGQTHELTYNLLCEWEKALNAKAVWFDQGEGGALYTLAMQAGKHHWRMFNFNQLPWDAPKGESEYANIRVQMIYNLKTWLMNGGILDSRVSDWIPAIQQQLCWTKLTRHKQSGKKLAEAKQDIKDRTSRSPDIADGAHLLFAQPDSSIVSSQEGGGFVKLMEEHPDMIDPLDLTYDSSEYENDMEVQSLYRGAISRGGF